jgi:hypothetical protein
LFWVLTLAEQRTYWSIAYDRRPWPINRRQPLFVPDGEHRDRIDDGLARLIA